MIQNAKSNAVSRDLYNSLRGYSTYLNNPEFMRLRNLIEDKFKAADLGLGKPSRSTCVIRLMGK